MFSSLRIFLRQSLARCGYALGTCLMRFWQRPMCDADSSVSVHLLVSSKTWHAGVLAVMSFEFFTQRRWNVFIHEDGSIDEATAREIEQVLPGVHFIPRVLSEEVMKKRLQPYPNCQLLRQEHNLFLKFFDLSAFAPGERMILLDSDVIFFKRPKEILAWVDSKSQECWYNEDTKEKYCIPRSEIESALGIKLWPRFNSGLVLMPLAAISLPLAEQLLTTFKTTAHHPQFFEQTLYALMASAWNPARTFHDKSTAACESQIQTASVSSSSSDSMSNTTIVATHRPPCLHQAARRLATISHETSGLSGALPSTYEISWGLFRRPRSICRHYVGAFKHDLLYIEGVTTLFLKMFFNL